MPPSEPGMHLSLCTRLSMMKRVERRAEDGPSSFRVYSFLCSIRSQSQSGLGATYMASPGGFAAILITAPLRRVRGFPTLGLLRELRPSSETSPGLLACRTSLDRRSGRGSHDRRGVERWAGRRRSWPMPRDHFRRGSGDPGSLVGDVPRGKTSPASRDPTRRHHLCCRVIDPTSRGTGRRRGRESRPSAALAWRLRTLRGQCTPDASGAARPASIRQQRPCARLHRRLVSPGGDSLEPPWQSR